ncbi:MAG: methyltransferase domain-containing protein [Chloroflexota bacterium]
MTITLDDLGFLSSDAGERVLSRLADEDLRDENTLKLITSLRRDLSLTQAGSALELARLRKKAVSKFGDDASKLYFTKDALEQASDPRIRKWRVWSQQDYKQVIDACCGIGADSLAFAQAGQEVIGLDIDPLRIEMARLNAQALGLKNVIFEVADVRQNVPDSDLIFFDPGRRDANGKRIFDVERYEPPLATIRDWKAKLILAKLSPGVDLAQIQAYAGQVDFLSVNGELKEADLRVYPQPTSAWYCAYLIGDHPQLPLMGQWCHDPALAPLAPISEPRGWLVEPDPAIIRSGQVAGLAIKLEGAQLDPEIAYITTDEKPNSPWARSWKINDWMPFNLKKLRAYLREQNVGTVTVKKRGTAVTPEELIAKLKLNGNGSRTIVLSRCRGDQIVMVCDDLTIEGGG